MSMFLFEYADQALAMPEPRWERPAMLIPGRKPVGGPVTIDWTHSLTKKLYGYYLFNTIGVAINIANRSVCPNAPFESNNNLGIDANGVYTESDGSANSELIVPGALVSFSGNNYTVSVIHSPDDLTGYVLVGQSNTQYAFYITASSTIHRTSGGPQTWSISRTTGTVYSDIVVNRGGTATIYTNGQSQGDKSITASFSWNSLNSYGNGNFVLDGKFYLAAIWDRALSPAEVQQIYTNPYAFLIPA